MRILLSYLFTINLVSAQFGKINVTVDDRLLRSSERQKIAQIKNDISRFFSSNAWNDDYRDLNINLNISLIFQNSSQKGGLETFHAQILISDGLDIRFFDKSLQFNYNSGGTLYFDPVIFNPLGSLLAFYAHLSIAYYVDTYDFFGGNYNFDIAREIALRGVSSDFSKGWNNRMQLLKEIYDNKGLREARFAFYVATELFNNGKPDQALEEYSIMMNGLEKVFRQFPTGRTLYFLNAHHRELANNLQILGQNKILEQLAIMDPAHKAIYLFKSNSR